MSDIIIACIPEGARTTEIFMAASRLAKALGMGLRASGSGNSTRYELYQPQPAEHPNLIHMPFRRPDTEWPGTAA